MLRAAVGNSTALRAIDGGVERFCLHDKLEGELERSRVAHVSNELIARSEEGDVASVYGNVFIVKRLLGFVVARLSGGVEVIIVLVACSPGQLSSLPSGVVSSRAVIYIGLVRIIARVVRRAAGARLCGVYSLRFPLPLKEKLGRVIEPVDPRLDIHALATHTGERLLIVGLWRATVCALRGLRVGITTA